MKNTALAEAGCFLPPPSQSEIIPQFLEECSIGGHYYAVPYMRSTEACYINKDYVEALGYTLPETLTWDFIWEVSEAATAKNADGHLRSEWGRGADSVHLQVHGQHDDPDAEAA